MKINPFLPLVLLFMLPATAFAQTLPDDQPVVLLSVRSVLPCLAADGKPLPNQSNLTNVPLPLYEALLRVHSADKLFDGAALDDIQIISVKTDSGEDLTKSFQPMLQLQKASPQNLLTKDSHDIAIGIFTTRPLPPNTAGLWVEGVVRPWILGDETVESDKIDFAPEIDATVKAGPLTLKLKRVDSFAGQDSLNAVFDVIGPANAIKKITFFNADGKSFTAGGRIERATSQNKFPRVSVISWKVPNPNACSVTYLSGCKRLEIPFRVALPSAQILVQSEMPPVPAATVAASQPRPLRPPIQLVGATINYFAEFTQSDNPFPPPFPGKPSISFLVCAALEDRHIVRSATPGMSLTQFLQDGRKLNQLPEAVASSRTSLYGYFDQLPPAPRHELFVEAHVNAVPSPTARRLLLSGDLRLSVGSTKRQKLSANDVQLVAGNSFVIDGKSIAITQVNPATDFIMRPLGSRVLLTVPPELKWRLIDAEVQDEGKALPTNFEAPFYFEPPLSVRSRSNPDLVSFTLEAPTPARAKVSLIAFDSLDEVRLPFNFTLGLGPIEKPKEILRKP